MTQIIAKGLSGEDIALGYDVVAGLQAKLCGELLRPGFARFETARQGWNEMIDCHPALIARCVDAVDVATTLTFVRAHRLLFFVQGGGHNVAGPDAVDGALLIDLSPMKKVRVDAHTCTVTAQAGSSLDDVDRATHPHYLRVDTLIAAEVVTTEGRILKVSESENADLFRAIRGGRGEFGIVTSFIYRSCADLKDAPLPSKRWGLTGM